MSRPRSAQLMIASFALATTAGACSERRTSPGAPGPSQSASASSSPAPGASVDVSDAGPRPYEGPWIGATILQTPIWSEMEFSSDKKADKDGKTPRLGYLRYGEKAPVLPEPHKKQNCSEGWYELLAGGFVCGKYATVDLEHPRFKLAKAPDLEGPLPYTYGSNVANGTPLYRQVPSYEERIKLEPWLVRPRKTNDDNPYAPATVARDAGTGDTTLIAVSAGDSQSDVPWWQKEAPDGGPPPVTLEDLQESGPVARRMVKGFFLSLDHQFPQGRTTWWRTVGGLVVPADRVLVAKPMTDFHGVWFGTDAGTFATKNVESRRIDKLPVAFVLTRTAKRWTLDANHKHPSFAEGSVDRFQAVGLTGEAATADGTQFWETDEGWWLRAVDGTKTEPGPAPQSVGEHDKWIDVNLRRQTLVAFEGPTTPIFATIFSSGRNEHETPPGSFRIREKHIAATMDGDADTAADGPYSIEDVPYIQYFNGGYAFHGAFWHAEFGHVKSHGCVNLAPWDAKALFGWTDPQLPDGWHAVFSTKQAPGTRVVVHGKAFGTCQGPKAEPPQCPGT